MSVLHRGPATPAIRSGWLSLAAAIEVVAALEDEYDVDHLGVKWPNDIYRGAGKLGGVLVESMRGQYIIGLGLNVYPSAGVARTSLTESLTGEFVSKSVDRQRLAASMIIALMRAFDCARQKSEDALLADWRRYDLLANREVTVLTSGGGLTGIARGPDKNGGLQVESDNGRMRVYYSGEVSVRW